MRKHIQPSTDDVSFDDAVQVVRRWLMSLVSAIGTIDYFDAWLASVQLRVALERAERLAGRGFMSSESRLLASRRLDDIRSIAIPMLALAPTPSRHEVRQMHTSNAYRGRRTQEHMEQQWERSVQQQMNADIFKEGENAQPGGSHDDHVFGIETAALRAVSLEMTGDLTSAAKFLGMARVSLERWIKRRN